MWGAGAGAGADWLFIDGTKCKSKLKSCFSQAGEGEEGGPLGNDYENALYYL